MHHLIRSGEMLGMMLMSWANVAYYQALMQGIREAIADDRFEDFRGETHEMEARRCVAVPIFPHRLCVRLRA